MNGDERRGRRVENGAKQEKERMDERGKDDSGSGMRVR